MEEKIKQAIKEANDAGYFVLCAIMNNKGEYNLEEIDYQTVSVIDKKEAGSFVSV